MGNLSKMLVTAGIIVLFIILFAVLVGTREDSGHSTPGFLSVILLVGVVSAIRAVWKKDDKDDNDNDSILQK